MMDGRLRREGQVAVSDINTPLPRSRHLQERHFGAACPAAPAEDVVEWFGRREAHFLPGRRAPLARGHCLTFNPLLTQRPAWRPTWQRLFYALSCKTHYSWDPTGAAVPK